MEKESSRDKELEDLNKLKDLKESIDLNEPISKDDAKSYYSVLQKQKSGKFKLLKKEEGYVLSFNNKVLPQEEASEVLEKLIDDFESSVSLRVEEPDFEYKEQRDTAPYSCVRDESFTSKKDNQKSWTPLVENIVMTAISGRIEGDAKVVQIAQSLGRLYLGNSKTISIQQAKDIILQEGAVSFTPEQLQAISQNIAIRMEAIRNIPLPLAKLQQGLIKHCKSEHWNLKRLFDITPVPIENSYITLSIITAEAHKKKQEKLQNLDPSEAITRDIAKAMEINERMPSHEDLFSHKEPIALSDLFKKQSDENESPKRLIVFGRAGIGKSVLCQYLAIRWRQEIAGNFEKPTQSLEKKSHAEKEQLDWIKSFKVVFWIRLREISDLLQNIRNDGSLENVINVCCYGGKENQEKLKHSLENHKNESLFILDGYDEIEEEALRIGSPVSMAWNILKEQPNIILTSRPTNNLDFLWPTDNRVRKLELMGFSNEQVENYVQNFMAEPPSLKDCSAIGLLNYLKSRPSIWGVAHIPINLEMLCWLYREEKLSQKAHSLSMLYEEIIKEVVFSMSVKNQEVSNTFDTAGTVVQTKTIAIHFLEHLAYRGMLKNELLLSKETIESAAREALKTYKNPEDKQLTKKLLETCHQLGFLFSTGQGGKSIADQTHYFIHLSFQEHFAARYVASRLTHNPGEKETHEIIKQIQEDKHKPRYHLMWRLISGLLTTQGKEIGNYDALSIFSCHVFLGFLHQDYMSEADFKLTAHCLDECIGVEKNILIEFLVPSKYENLKIKMTDYFSCFIFYSQSNLCQKNLETFERCLNFFSIIPSMDESFFKKLIELAKDKSFGLYERRKAFEILLKIPEKENEAAEELIAWAANKSVDSPQVRKAWEILLKRPNYVNKAAAALIEFANEKINNASYADSNQSIEACKTLLKIPEYANQAAAALIAGVQNKSIVASQRMCVLEVLLKIPENFEKAVEGLTALAKDEGLRVTVRIEAYEALLRTIGHTSEMPLELIRFAEDKKIYPSLRRRIWGILLEIPEHASKAAEGLIVLAEDKTINASEERQTLEILLKIPEHAKKAAGGLIVLAEDKTIDASQRRRTLEILLKIPEHAKKAAEGLIVLAAETIDASEKSQIWEILLEISEHAKEAVERLIALAADETVDASQRRQTWEILLKKQEYAKKAIAELISRAEDEGINAYQRIQACEILLEMPEHAKKAKLRIIACVNNKSVDISQMTHVLKTLLQIPEDASSLTQNLTALGENKSVQDTIAQTRIIKVDELREFLTLVAAGEEGKAEKMLKINPDLALVSGNVTDLSDRVFTGITGFQYAVWALDWHMWIMIRKYLSDDDARKQAQRFETGAWVNAHGVHANWGKLLEALESYTTNHEKWDDKRKIEHWTQEVGKAQILLPAHVINEYCHPVAFFSRDFSIQEKNNDWRRRQTTDGDWFNAECTDGTCGFSFAWIRSSYENAGWGWAANPPCNLKEWETINTVAAYPVMADCETLKSLYNVRNDQRESLLSDLNCTNVQIQGSENNEISEFQAKPSNVIHLNSDDYLKQKGSPILTQFKQPVIIPAVAKHVLQENNAIKSRKKFISCYFTEFF